MRKLLLIALIAVGALFMLPALPVHAQTGVQASISGVSGGQTISGSVDVRGCGSAGTGVKEVWIMVDGRIREQKVFGNVQTEGCTSYRWDTTRSGSGLSSNGRYTLSVRAISTTGAHDEVGIYVYVDNGTSTPTGFSVTSSIDTVSMSWAQNPEPDITSYKIERDSGAGWSVIGETGGTSYSEVVPEGTHSYRVIAFRESPASGTRGSSASEVNVVTTTAPPPPPPSDGTDTGSNEDGTGDTGGNYDDGYGNGTGANGGGYGGGAGVPGYSGSSGRGGDRGAGPMGSTPGGLPSGYLSSGSRSLSGIGLPGGLTLPGSTGDTGSALGTSIDDGIFEETLPYELSDSDGTLVNDPGNPFRPAFINGMKVIPPDALRWVGAGMWLLVTAFLLKFLERRVAAKEQTTVAHLSQVEETAA